jgi:hypothetical protein
MTSRSEALKRYVSGWFNYFGYSQSYAEVVELDQGLRRDEVALATRSRKGH